LSSRSSRRRTMSRCRSCEPVAREVRLAADLLERRWLLQMIVAAHSGAVRFNEFGSSVVGISPRMLSSRLRDLERAGIIARTVIPDSPPGVEYRLTERGRALGPLVDALRRYAAV
jgi:DNA-binding HxlR family transcriptional regulator